MTVRVKICGVRTADAFDAVAAAGADWVGFVFFPPSPRAVTPAEAAALSVRHAAGPARVGLFVQPTDDEVARALDALPRVDVSYGYADADGTAVRAFLAAGAQGIVSAGLAPGIYLLRVQRPGTSQSIKFVKQ